ncbi:methyltransferase domain-containing protein [Aestuariibacter salexigens]|uniref:methyltransferase domain-containing protein n=1 Tax=Aestuariibacter salexigens TaxID=226010 RepID=UPI0003FBA723|nr:methyltransferase domain-containing protein [Aestuariibacter salexigens]
MTSNDKPDQSFDSLTNKFEKNIYGTSKGKLRHELLLHGVSRHLSDAPGKQVLDAGGGTGIFAQALTELGDVSVTVIDTSAEILERARQQYAHNDALSFIHSPIQSFEAPQQYDIVVCHAVLEWLQQPLCAIDKLVSWLKPGGLLSLSFFNQDAKLFANAVYGNFDYIFAGMQVKNQVRLNPQNPQSPKVILQHLQDSPLEIVYQRGIRCFHDYLRDKTQQQRDYDKLKQLELQYGEQHPYLWLGKYFHIIARRVE